jgi:hypothetical protein
MTISLGREVPVVFFCNGCKTPTREIVRALSEAGEGWFGPRKKPFTERELTERAAKSEAMQNLSERAKAILRAVLTAVRGGAPNGFVPLTNGQIKAAIGTKSNKTTDKALAEAKASGLLKVMTGGVRGGKGGRAVNQHGVGWLPMAARPTPFPRTALGGEQVGKQGGKQPPRGKQGGVNPLISLEPADSRTSAHPERVVGKPSRRDSTSSAGTSSLAAAPSGRGAAPSDPPRPEFESSPNPNPVLGHVCGYGCRRGCVLACAPVAALPEPSPEPAAKSPEPSQPSAAPAEQGVDPYAERRARWKGGPHEGGAPPRWPPLPKPPERVRPREEVLATLMGTYRLGPRGAAAMMDELPSDRGWTREEMTRWRGMDRQSAVAAE